jgi:hypothetical protein
MLWKRGLELAGVPQSAFVMPGMRRILEVALLQNLAGIARRFPLTVETLDRFFPLDINFQLS